MGVFNIFKRPDLPTQDTPVSNSDIRYLEMVLREWLDSDIRKEQLLADKYYDGDHDILKRERKVIGADGLPTTINNVVNNRLVDNQYRKLVDQKTNYALGKPMTIATTDATYLAELTKIFGKKMHRKLRVLGRYAVNGGIAWLYPYYNSVGKLDVMVFQSHEICPLWVDKAHTELAGVMRYYDERQFNKKGGVEKVYHVDLYTTDGITHFRYNRGALKLEENPHSAYMYKGDKEYTWEKLPMIPFKYNADEIPLIRATKSLQDALNELISDFQNNMQEDPRSTILVLKNYDGTNIPEFRQNLATYGVIKVTTVDGVQGGVETLNVEVNAENYKAILMQLKRAIVENGRGFDAKEERMDGDPNQMNIESMYTDIDLDVNAMETEFQAGFEELKWFIDQYLVNNGKADYSEHDVNFVLNRDIFINENAMIDNCVKSKGIISDKTIIARHPWVTNLERELQQIEEDKKAELEEMDATLKVQNKNTNEPMKQGGDSNG